LSTGVLSLQSMLNGRKRSGTMGLCKYRLSIAKMEFLDNIKFLAWQDYAGLNLNQKVKPKKSKRKMKRQYLFRGWSESLNRWVEGDLVHDSFDGSSRVVALGIKPIGSFPIPVHPDSVGQFTGLMDIEGNKIFEEMRVCLIDPKNSLRMMEYIVKFDNSAFYLFHLPEYIGGQRWGLLSRVSELCWNIHITGNTFNPDKA